MGRFLPSSGARRRVLVLVLGWLLLPLGVGASRAAPTDDVQDHLRLRIEAAQQGASAALMVEGTPLLAPQAVARYYQQNGFDPAWTRPSGPMVLADSLVAVLRDADREGLQPADYHVAEIESMLRRLQARAGAGEPMDPRRRADIELLCTDAFLLYASHLLTGRVDPVQITPSWNMTGRQAQLSSHLERALTDTSIRSVLKNLRPPQPEYAALRRALARYRTLEEQGGWPTLPDGPKLERGTEDERIPLLRRRLRVTGDFPDDVTPADSLTFGPTLQEAVSQFQERHGLEVDGVVGPATRAALNVPAEARAEQLKVNLERWRWLPQDLGNPHVLVNIAGFRLRVVEDGADVLRMRVIAGQPYRQTPVFSDQISYLVLNPYWHVPQSIATKDKLPDFRRDPSLVSTLGYEIFRGWGADAKSIDPSTIDWNAVSASNFPYRLRQRPGPQNALGQVKFMFPNSHDVYLHDTPSRALFDRAARSFSSGCIRVEKPVDLAEYLLQHNEDWTRERLQNTMGKTTEQAVPLARKVPVHLLYWTAWTDEEGAAHFRNDVYERDGAVLSGLTSRPPAPASLSEEADADR